MIGRNFGLATRKFHAFSREIIKPSSSSTTHHHHLKYYNLSPMDLLVSRTYMPFVLFFPSSPGKFGEKSLLLKHSLSKTLTDYYPFAGRLTSRASIDCNDKGIEFHESQINCTVSEFLEKYEDDLDHLDMVFSPNSVWETFDDDSSLMIVRVNHFDCGGIAIAVCMSHRVGDASTLSNFMTYWAVVTRQSGEQVLPNFIFSPSNHNDVQEYSPLSKKNMSITRKKYVFKNTEIANLKAKVCSSDGQIPTRFEFLSTLFYKCAMSVEQSKSGSFRPSVLFNPVNMRSNIIPPLPKTTVGNWIWRHSIEARTESESSWKNLIDQSKKEKKKIEGMKYLDANEFKSSVVEFIKNNYKTYICTSLCNLDLYKVNFGWGNPVRVALGDSRVGDGYAFFDTPSRDGIEVLASFEEQEMVKIQLHKELDELASLN